MRRSGWLAVLLAVVVGVSVVHAQSLAEAARKEKERRAKLKKSARKVRVLTQKDLEKLRDPKSKIPVVVVPRGARKAPPAARDTGTTTGPTETGAAPAGEAASIEDEIVRLQKERQKKEAELNKAQAELKDLLNFMDSTNAIYMSTTYGQLMRKKRLLEEKIARLQEEIRQIDEQLEKLNEALSSVG